MATPPMSRSKIDRLGKRMSELGALPADDDRAAFGAVLDFYQDLLDGVAERLIESSLRPTSRVKTTGTILEKLRRERGIQLSRIQDLAGARVVVAGTRLDQDLTVETIREMFAGEVRNPDVIDRRASPSSGYRAVHVVVYPLGYPVEIQVRTRLQDTWAQIFERTADQWGRQIRYGGEPNVINPDPLAEPPVTQAHVEAVTQLRRQTIVLLGRVSESIEKVETSQAVNHDVLRILNKTMAAEIGGFDVTLVDEMPQGLKDAYFEFRKQSISTLSKYESDKRRRGRLVRRNIPKGKMLRAGIVKINAETGRLLSGRVLQSVSKTGQNERMLVSALQHISQIPETELD